MKTCSSCKIPQLFSAFRRRKHSKDGFAGQCRRCKREKEKASPSGSPERGREYGRRNRTKNRHRINERNRIAYRNDPEKFRQRKRDEAARRTPEEREARLEKRRKKYAEDLSYRQTLQRRNRHWHATHRDLSRSLAKQWAEKYPDRVRDRQLERVARIKASPVIERIDRQVIIQRDNQRCHICKKKVRLKDLTLDHLIPLRHGGPHTALNLAVAHRACNSSHGAGRFPVQLLLIG